MATSVFRSNEAKVKDALKLFTLSYLTSAVWMPGVVFGPGRFGLVILDLADLDLVISDLVILSLAILEFMLCIWTITTIC